MISLTLQFSQTSSLWKVNSYDWPLKLNLFMTWVIVIQLNFLNNPHRRQRWNVLFCKACFLFESVENFLKCSVRKCYFRLWIHKNNKWNNNWEGEEGSWALGEVRSALKHWFAYILCSTFYYFRTSLITPCYRKDYFFHSYFLECENPFFICS